MVNLDERDAVHVRPGAAAIVTPDAHVSAPRKGAVARVAGALDPKTRTMRIQIDLENSDHAYRPGQYVRVALEIFSRPRALTVAAPCLAFGAGGAFVFVVDKGTVRRQPVKTGLDDGIVVEVLEGLREGAEVVYSGQAALRDGMPVRTQPERN